MEHLPNCCNTELWARALISKDADYGSCGNSTIDFCECGVLVKSRFSALPTPFAYEFRQFDGSSTASINYDDWNKTTDCDTGRVFVGLAFVAVTPETLGKTITAIKAVTNKASLTMSPTLISTIMSKIIFSF